MSQILHQYDNDAISVFTSVCLLEWGGGGGLLKTFIDYEN